MELAILRWNILSRNKNWAGRKHGPAVGLSCYALLLRASSSKPELPPLSILTKALGCSASYLAFARLQSKTARPTPNQIETEVLLSGDTLCYAIMLLGRKSAFRARFWPDCYREYTDVGSRHPDPPLPG